MSSKEDAKNRVVFRRIGGRIVPMVIGAGAIGAGIAVDSKKFSKAYDKAGDKLANRVASGKNNQRLATIFTGNKEIAKQNAFYNKVLTRVTGDHFYGGGDGKYDPFVKKFGKFDDRPGQWMKTKDNPYPYKKTPRMGRPFAQYMKGAGTTTDRIKTNVKNLSLILHEAGHHQQYKAGGKSIIMDNKALKKIDEMRFNSFMEARKIKNSTFSAPSIGLYERDLLGKKGLIKRELQSQFIKRSRYAFHKTRHKIFDTIMKPYRFGIEMEANVNAVKMANKLRGPKFARITAKAMIPNVLGYGKTGIIKSAKYGLIGVGVLSLYNALKGNKK